jgi:sugar lactone lactonase YvrE
MTTLKTENLVGDLCFPEGPRWNADDGRLWFSDMHDQTVYAVDLEGRIEAQVRVPANPSGLGWDREGRLLVVSMTDRRLLRLGTDGLEEVADLSGIAEADCNDMVVDAEGRAYIGNFGGGLEVGDDGAFVPPPSATLVRVDPDGSVHVAAKDLVFPNGTQITPDGRTLIVGETFAGRLTAFDVDSDGSLGNRRVWAEVPGCHPDGSCLDAEGAVWIASPFQPNKVLRVVEGGAVTDEVEVGTSPYACMLGGEDRRTLFVCTASSAVAEQCRKRRDGAIETVRVAVPGEGLP